VNAHVGVSKTSVADSEASNADSMTTEGLFDSGQSVIWVLVSPVLVPVDGY